MRLLAIRVRAGSLFDTEPVEVARLVTDNVRYKRHNPSPEIEGLEDVGRRICNKPGRVLIVRRGLHGEDLDAVTRWDQPAQNRRQFQFGCLSVKGGEGPFGLRSVVGRVRLLIGAPRVGKLGKLVFKVDDVAKQLVGSRHTDVARVCRSKEGRADLEVLGEGRIHRGDVGEGRGQDPYDVRIRVDIVLAHCQLLKRRDAQALVQKSRGTDVAPGPSPTEGCNDRLQKGR